jgi:predicted ferric reductase
VYEWFLNSHTLLALGIVTAAWVHIAAGKPAWLILRIGIGLWTLATVVHWLLFAFRNFVFGRSFARATATPLRVGKDSDSVALQIDITVPRSWDVRAGQTVFLSIPKLGVFRGLRGHPFMISWWDRDPNRGVLTLSLLAEVRTGFTAGLSQLAHQGLAHKKLDERGLDNDGYAAKDFLAFIDGPYGAPHGFGEYGTVVMIASGIGIAGHMSYIRDLITGNLNCTVQTQRVFLVWQMEKASEYGAGVVRFSSLMSMQASAYGSNRGLTTHL